MGFLATYLIVMADNIHSFFITTMIGGGIVSLFWFLIIPAIMADGYGSRHTFASACQAIKVRTAMKVFFPITLISLLGVCAMPNTKQLAVIYLIPTVTQNQHIQGISTKTLKLMDGYLQKWLNELDDEVSGQLTTSSTAEPAQEKSVADEATQEATKAAKDVAGKVISKGADKLLQKLEE